PEHVHERDEHYTPFKGSPSSDPLRLEAVTVFVMGRFRGDRTDSMRGSLRAGPHGWDAVYMLNGELYQSQWFAAEAQARAGLDASRRARGRRLDAGAISRVIADGGRER